MIIIDRIEGNFAVCEFDGKDMCSVDLKDFAYTPKEGDCIYKSDGKYFYDEAMTLQRQKQIKELMSSVFKKSKENNRGSN